MTQNHLSDGTVMPRGAPQAPHTLRPPRSPSLASVPLVLRPFCALDPVGRQVQPVTPSEQPSSA